MTRNSDALALLADPDNTESGQSGSPWLQAYPSVRFDLLHPTPDMVDFRTMARVLARIPRFAAQTTGDLIYSDAQHCVEGARAIMRDTGRRDAAAAFLIHDGHEYIIGDMARPVHDAIVCHAVLVGELRDGDIVRNAIRALKNSLDAAIYPAAGLPWPLPADIGRIVKEYDLRMGRTERDAFMAAAPAEWHDTYENQAPVEGCSGHVWGQHKAENLFNVTAYHYLPAFKR